MNRVLVALGIACTLAGAASADSFDIASFSPPSGWSRQDAKDIRAFTTVDKAAGTFCRIALHASMKTLGSPKLDFDADWRDLIATPYKPTAAPKLDTREVRGWKVTAGGAPFAWDKREAVAMLYMMTSTSKRFAVSYIATGDCLAQLGSVIDSLDLASAERAAASDVTPPPTTTAPATSGVTIQKDFVEARQGKVVVRLHYATPIPDGLRGDPEAKRDHFWNTFVAPRYADVKNVR
jgi:hypothetical protein